MALKRWIKFPARSFFILYYVYPKSTYVLIAGLVCFIALGLALSWLISILSLVCAIVIAVLLLAIDIKNEAGAIRSDPYGFSLEIRGPFLDISQKVLRRNKLELDLGDRPLDMPIPIELFIHNIGKTEQVVQINMKWDAECLEMDSELSFLSGPYEPGEIRRETLTITPKMEKKTVTKVHLTVSTDKFIEQRTLPFHSIFDIEGETIKEARVERWKYGKKAATCWRGDIDGLDNLNNEKIFQRTFDLCLRFRFPISLFLSGRLSLNYEEWLPWIENYREKFDEQDLSRERFNRFRDFLSEKISKEDSEYPLLDAGHCAEIGNHMYHHYGSSYGYDSSRENNWRRNLEPGDVTGISGIPGPSQEKNLLENIVSNQSIINDSLGVKPRTWAAPANRSHPAMPRILESVGLIGSSEGDVGDSPRLPNSIAPYRPDLGGMLPYHPDDTRLVETQAHIRRFDPHTITHLICSKRAVQETIRIGGQMTFLVHPHLRQYAPFFGSSDCGDIMREFLRYLAQVKNPYLWNTTHSSIVRYWERILCPKHRVFTLGLENNSVVIHNNSSSPLESIPVQIDFKGGKKMMILANVPANDIVNLLSIVPKSDTSQYQYSRK